MKEGGNNEGRNEVIREVKRRKEEIETGNEEREGRKDVRKRGRKVER